MAAVATSPSSWSAAHRTNVFGLVPRIQLQTLRAGIPTITKSAVPIPTLTSVWPEAFASSKACQDPRANKSPRLGRATRAPWLWDLEIKETALEIFPERSQNYATLRNQTIIVHSWSDAACRP